MLFRLAQNEQSPTVRLMVESESLGEQPVYNVIGTIEGSRSPTSTSCCRRTSIRGKVTRARRTTARAR